MSLRADDNVSSGLEVFIRDSLSGLPTEAQVQKLNQEAHRIRYRDNVSAIQYLKYAETLATPDALKFWRMAVKSNLAEIFVNTGLFEEALEVSYEGIAIARELKAVGEEIYFLYWLSACYHELGEFERSVQTCFEALALSKKTGDEGYILRSWNALGEAWRFAGDYHRADSAYLNAFGPALASEPDSTMLCILYNNLALSALAQKNYENTGFYLQQLIACKVDRGNPIWQEMTYSRVGLLEGQGLRDSARILALEAIGLAKALGFPKYELLFAKWLSESFRDSGNFAAAIQYLERYYAIRNTMKNHRAMTRVAMHERKGELERLARAASVLEADKEYQRKFMFGLLGLLLIILVLFWQLRRQNKAMRQLNQALRDKNRRLDEANREINGLISVVAHDLRSPISKTKGLISLIQPDQQLGADHQLYLQVMGQVLEGGENLIQDVLTMSSVEQEQETRFASVDVAELVRLSIAGFSESARLKGIHIDADLPTELRLNTEASHLSRVFDNLLSNAIKFSPRDKTVYVSLRKEGKQVNLAVRDEGPGISVADQQKMFRKFQKLSARPTAGESSTGLGLSIVKSLLEKLGGNIHVESEPGNGACFVVILNA